MKNHVEATLSQPNLKLLVDGVVEDIQKEEEEYQNNTKV